MRWNRWTRSPRGWRPDGHSLHPQAGTFTVFVVFPLLLLATAPDAAYWYRMVPTGPRRFALEISGLYPEDATHDAAAMEDEKGRLLAIHLEDIPMCARTQTGLESANAFLGPLSHLESGLVHFRNWLM